MQVREKGESGECTKDGKLRQSEGGLGSEVEASGQHIVLLMQIGGKWARSQFSI